MEKYSSFARKSMSMGEKIPNFSMIGVYDMQPKGIQFVKIHNEQLEGKFCVILFMDNKAFDLEIKEWQAFSSSFEEFNEMKVKLIGVCTDSHYVVRAFMHDHHLQGIKFPIIRSEMVYRQLKNEKVASDPRAIISFLRNAKAEAAAKKTGFQMELDVSEELAAIIGTNSGERISRPQCVKRLWAYLKEHNLQDPENKQFFTPDATMEPVFGNERMRAFHMSKYLKKHLFRSYEMTWT